MPKTYGYARISTAEQDEALQVAALTRYGVAREDIAVERASGGTMDRPVWNDLLAQMEEGDTLVLYRLDRLGRTLMGVLATVDEMLNRGLNIKTVEGEVDTSSAMGRAFFQIGMVFAEFERSLISERTKAGMAARIEACGKFGAPHKIRDNPRRMAAARALRDAGRLDVLTARELQTALNVADLRGKPIGHINTVRIWRRAGYPGL